MNEFTRNKVRNQLIPLLETINPAIRNSIMRLGYISSKTNEYIRSQAFIAWDKVTTVHPNGVHIDKTRFTKLDGAIQHILIRMVYKHLTGTLRKLDQKHVMAVINNGFKPKFVDIDPDTYNLDVTKLESAINKKAKSNVRKIDVPPIL